MCLPVAVIVKLIVGGESDEASPSSRQREEDLSGCIFPHLTEEETKSKEQERTSSAKGIMVGLKKWASDTFASFSFSHFGVIK